MYFCGRNMLGGGPVHPAARYLGIDRGIAEVETDACFFRKESTIYKSHNSKATYQVSTLQCMP